MKIFFILLVIIILILCLYFLRRKKVAVYTCFFGSDDNGAFVINEPELKYDCYYFTNNKKMIEKLKSSKWKGIYVDIPIKNNLTLDSFDSKKLKACPHYFDILNKYDITIYMDSKLKLKKNIYKLIEDFDKSNYSYVIPKHPFLHDVWGEYNECLSQPRYEIEKDKYKKYIEKNLEKGYKNKLDYHYTTCFIIRKNDKKTNEINDRWYENIIECGIECQISFFFIQQMFNNFIFTIEPQFHYSY